MKVEVQSEEGGSVSKGYSISEGETHPTGNFLQKHARISAGLLTRFLEDPFKDHARFIQEYCNLFEHFLQELLQILSGFV